MSAQKESPYSFEQVRLIPIFENNYVFIIEQSKNNFILVDPGDFNKVDQYFTMIGRDNIKLNILITHHHHDHIGGLKLLSKKYNCEIWAPRISEYKIPEANHFLDGEEIFNIENLHFQVRHLPGHTLDHLIYYEINKKWLFVGDVLFQFGCGRLFEGDFETAFNSLQKLKQYPNDSLVFCTHEYTENNILFAINKAQEENDSNWLSRLNDENKKIISQRRNNLSTIPFFLGNDINNNPFLRAKNSTEFKRLRTERNLF